MTNLFCEQTGAQVPLICGAMYPCSNWELIAAVAAAGGMPVVQPVSLVFAHKTDLREALRKIREVTPNPIGFNAIVEQSSQAYEDRMRAWIDTALEEGVRFFVTALGNPRWVVDKVHAVGGVVYHDVTERKWAEKAIEAGVDGLICVNNRAGGHAGTLAERELWQSMSDLGVPLVCAGGVGDPDDFKRVLDMGFVAAQLGTRFIATEECSAHADYKAAIVKATSPDIVLTDKISGVPVSVIKTEYIERVGTKAGPIARRMLRHRKLKHYVRMFYTARSVWQLKNANNKGGSYKDYWQAGKSVDGVTSILPAGEVVRAFAEGIA